MIKFLDIVLCLLVALSIGSYFGKEYINNHLDEHYAYNTKYWGPTDAPEHSIESDKDVDFTFVVNYYSNSDNSGVELYEIKVNYYTDYQLQDIYSLGLQIVNPSEMEFTISMDKMETTIFPWVNDNYYHSYHVKYGSAQKAYFNTDDGVSFKATTTFNERNVPYIIRIDGKPYSFDFNKQNTYLYNTSIWGKKTYVNYTSNFDYFLYKVYKATTDITDGTGVYKNMKLELDDVFNMYEYNKLTGKFDILSTFGYDVSYVSFKVNYYETGAKRHEHSLFNQIGSDPAGGVIWENQ